MQHCIVHTQGLGRKLDHSLMSNLVILHPYIHVRMLLSSTLYSDITGPPALNITSMRTPYAMHNTSLLQHNPLVVLANIFPPHSTPSHTHVHSGTHYTHMHTAHTYTCSHKTLLCRSQFAISSAPSFIQQVQCPPTCAARVSTLMLVFTALRVCSY